MVKGVLVATDRRRPRGLPAFIGVTVGLVAFGSLVPASAGGGVLRLSRDEGPPTILTRVQGAGFGAVETVTVAFDDQAVVASSHLELVPLDSGTGDELWRLVGGPSPGTTTAGAEGRVFVGYASRIRPACLTA